MDSNINKEALMKERNTKHENSINEVITVNIKGKKEVLTTDPNGNLFFWKI